VRSLRALPLAKLIYAAIASLDGYVADDEGKFDWAALDEEVHRFVNDLERPVGTYLYGRRMYEVMAVWETIRGQWSVARQRGLRGDLAGGRQDRVLHQTRDRLHYEDEDRASLRSRSSPAVEGSGRT
jgi:dihydrofolate reductase